MNLKSSPTLFLTTAEAEVPLLVTLLSQIRPSDGSSFLDRLLDSSRVLIIGRIDNIKEIPDSVKTCVTQIYNVDFDSFKNTLETTGQFQYIIQCEEFVHNHLNKNLLTSLSTAVSQEFRFISDYCRQNNAIFIKLCPVKKNPIAAVKSTPLGGFVTTASSNMIYEVQTQKNLASPRIELLITVRKDRMGLEPKNFIVPVPEDL